MNQSKSSSNGKKSDAKTDNNSNSRSSVRRRTIKWDEEVIQEHDKERGTRQKVHKFIR